MDPVAASIRNEPTLNELIDARDRADGGIRLAMPQLAERIGLSAVTLDEEDEIAPLVSPELGDLIVARMDDVRVHLRKTAAIADHCGDRAAHIAISEAQDKVAELTATLIARWSA